MTLMAGPIGGTVGPTDGTRRLTNCFEDIPTW